MNVIIGKNQIIYYIAAGVICLQGLLCIAQIKTGIQILSYVGQTAQYQMMQGIAFPRGLLAWGVFYTLAGAAALAGFLFAGIAAFARKQLLVGVGAGITAVSYLLAILREAVNAYVNGGAGFLFLNVLGLGILVCLMLTALTECGPLKKFLMEYHLIAMLIPIALFLLTLVVAGAGHGMSVGTVIYNLAENVAQTGMVVVIGALLTGEVTGRTRALPEPGVYMYAGGSGYTFDTGASGQRSLPRAVTEEGQDMGDNRNSAFDTSNSIQPPEGYRSVALVVIFGIITFGIYLYYWVYKMSERLNAELRTGKSPVAQMLLYIFVPFYSWYWIYQATQQLNEYSRRQGRDPDPAMPVINLVVTIFGLAIVAIALMQDTFNRIVGEREGAAWQWQQGLQQARDAQYEPWQAQEAQPGQWQQGPQQAQAARQNGASGQPADVYEELRKLKALLDEGIITQEEFEQMKKKYLT